MAHDDHRSTVIRTSDAVKQSLDNAIHRDETSAHDDYIGGLCLAQGLRRAGVAVSVYERTKARTDWLQGYRIHINPHGSRALHDCLPPAAWQTFLETVSVDGGGFGFTTERLNDLLRLCGDEITQNSDPENRHYGVSRISLRAVLLTGMDDIVHLGKTFERYEVTDDGRVAAHFTDGSSAISDVLIGADGANSRVRQQLLPHAERIDTGILAIAGKHRLDRAGVTLPRLLTHDVNLVVPAGRGFLFTAVWHPDRRTVWQDTDSPEGFLLDNSAAYTFWAYADASSAFPLPEELESLSGSQLIRLVLDRTTGWAPALQDLVAGSNADTVNAVRVRSSTPVDAWQTGPVTLLGDAIHNMTPMAGIGANTALRDADLLRRQLTAVNTGEQPLLPALHEYERQMLDYGFAAVKQSLRNARQAGSANRLARGAFRTTLRIVNAMPLLRRRMAAQLGQ